MSDRLVIPLWYRPPQDETGLSSGLFVGRQHSDEGMSLVTADTLGKILSTGLEEEGLPRFHVFDMPCEARAANTMLQDDSGRSRGEDVTTGIGQLRDGEAVLMVVNETSAFCPDSLTIHDHRNGACRRREVFGSWELPEAECRSLMEPGTPVTRADLANVLAAKISEMPAEILRDTQVALEGTDGAYVGFVSVSEEDVRREIRDLELLADEDIARIPTADIQAQIRRASSKAELGDALSEALDATIERLKAAHPEIFGNDAEETPGP